MLQSLPMFLDLEEPIELQKGLSSIFSLSIVHRFLFHRSSVDLFLCHYTSSLSIEKQQTEAERSYHLQSRETTQHQPHSGRRSRGQCDLAASLVPDCKQLGKESSRARHAAVVAMELEEDEDEDATKETDCGDVEKVLDVAIPGAVHSDVAVEGRGRRRRGSLVHWGGGFGD
ncbi:hypothetical protein SLEP1_g40924 [Rubroshorea leprosula]|uniref:Uncharacterized protein n=1 Tax=Rubroshorea leprosula TaxID=152421 RepID=A0AAV5L5C2_9ROSI|nr:hypothetical protein SLEP1_g40924 [Rubroshorea leprosula]